MKRARVFARFHRNASILATIYAAYGILESGIRFANLERKSTDKNFVSFEDEFEK